ncbi:MAG TPA: 4-alpha-glucanotransferase [Clostridia bacterium]|nr:4-alpha-glucanotransferase [Clostridia bacterium]
MRLQLERASGVLLHPTSLPSEYGIGEIGGEARKFINFLEKGGFKLWQILPLNPVGYGESPYQSFSAFAGNPLLISLDCLRKEGLLSRRDLADAPSFPKNKVDYPFCREFKSRMLRQAYLKFKSKGLPSSDFAEFKERNLFWLEDYAFFMALKERFGNIPWNYWDKSIALREPLAIKFWEERLEEEVNYHLFLQYKFFSQWQNLKEYATEKGIRIIGDLPLYVSYDSSDAWVHSHLFELDEAGYPLKVGGVPPDYFSPTGQLWGNPLYKWEEMAKNDYLWWRERIKVLLELVDVIRLDHFRGFEAYWEVPATEKTAVKGRWVKGPGEKFFSVITEYLGDLPLMAEDLGFITPEVIELREKFNFPGMKVLQFIDREPFPASVTDEGNWAYYTGTHDNNTLLGWYEETILAQLEAEHREKWRENICWEFIELLYQSRAQWVIIPLQDLLELDAGARMNIPGTVGGNWEWRFQKGDLKRKIAKKARSLQQKYAR